MSSTCSIISQTNSNNYGFNGFKTTEMIIFGGKRWKKDQHLDALIGLWGILKAEENIFTKAYPNILCRR